MTENDLFRALSGLDPELILQAEPRENRRGIVKAFLAAASAVVACLAVLVLLMNIPNFIGYQGADPNADDVISSVRIDRGNSSFSYWRKDQVRPIFDFLTALESSLIPMEPCGETPTAVYRITISFYEGESREYLLTETLLVNASFGRTYRINEEQYTTLSELLNGKESAS